MVWCSYKLFSFQVAEEPDLPPASLPSNFTLPTFNFSSPPPTSSFTSRTTPLTTVSEEPAAYKVLPPLWPLRIVHSVWCRLDLSKWQFYSSYGGQVFITHHFYLFNQKPAAPSTPPSVPFTFSSPIVKATAASPPYFSPSVGLLYSLTLCLIQSKHL